MKLKACNGVSNRTLREEICEKSVCEELLKDNFIYLFKNY